MRREEMAAAADARIRRDYDQGLEILYCAADDSFVEAMPLDDDEGGDPYQPTAVFIGCADDFEDADALYERAVECSWSVYRLAEARWADREEL